MDYDIKLLQTVGFTFGASMRNEGEFAKETWGMQIGNLTYLEYDPDMDSFCIVGESVQFPNYIWGLHTFEEIKQLAKLFNT